MSIFNEVSNHAAYISLKLGKLKKDTPEYDATLSTKEAILALGKELSITNGTNSSIVKEKRYKSRPIPSCRATHSADQSIPQGGAPTALAFNTVVWDDLAQRNDKSANFHSGTVNNTKFYIHEEGKYHVVAYINYEALAGTVCYAVASIERWEHTTNTRFIVAQQSSYQGTILGNAFGSPISVSVVVYAFPGDYIQILAFQENNSGGVGSARLVTANVTSAGFTYLSPDCYIAGPL